MTTLEVIPAFPTLIGQWLVPDAEAMNHELQALILAEEHEIREPRSQQHRRLALTNRFPQSPRSGRRRIEHVDHLDGEQNGCRPRLVLVSFKGVMSVSAWATICRAGAYHAPHSHPDSAWSGVYYVDAGTNDIGSIAERRAGVPRSARRRGGRHARRAIRTANRFESGPKPGLIVIFPSWLYHWVHPYAGSHAAHRGLFQRDRSSARHRSRVGTADVVAAAMPCKSYQ